jgi:molecular chaperone GrpE
MAVTEKKNHENMVKEAVEEAKAKAAKGKEENLDSLEEEIIDTVEELEEEIEEEFEEVESNISDDETGEDVMETEEDKEGKKKIFGKKKKDKKDEKIEELTDRLTRQMAEFDNFRKRTDKEKSNMYEIGAKDIIDKLLPVVDNFERGFEAIGEEDKEHPFIDGMDKVYKHLMTTLESAGVKAIEAVGEPFNPDFHNAVMHVEDEEHGENTVIEEFQKGYTYRDGVVRYSMVKVAN